VLSLNARLLVAATLVLGAFLGLTGLTLDQAFRQSVLENSRERLQTDIYLLLSAADPDERGSLALPEALPEPKLSSPGSGLYAEVRTGEGDEVWASASSVGMAVPYPEPEQPGVPAFVETLAADGSSVLALSYAVTWELGRGEERGYVFSVAESRAGPDAQVAAFRRDLWVWLGVAAGVLLAAQAIVLTWSLAPLRRVAREVREIESGERRELEGEYPRELRLLTQNLNALIRASRTQLERYRHSLADLAHSLKTPLAVLRTSAEDERSQALAGVVIDQVSRMDQTVDYQLQRAAASGRTVLATPVDVADVAERLMDSLQKVYADKSPWLELRVEEDTLFMGDPGDLTEILGNLADNACKWCRKRVEVRARNQEQAEGHRPRLVIEVEDDGPGIPEERRAEVLKRGIRADELVPGQGIGLAVVREIVEEVYKGSVAIAEGELGGTLVRVAL